MRVIAAFIFCMATQCASAVELFQSGNDFAKCGIRFVWLSNENERLARVEQELRSMHKDLKIDRDVILMLEGKDNKVDLNDKKQQYNRELTAFEAKRGDYQFSIDVIGRILAIFTEKCTGRMVPLKIWDESCVQSSSYTTWCVTFKDSQLVK